MDMLNDELKTKVHVLEDIEQLLYTLDKVDKQIQKEVNNHINEKGNQNINHLKELENEIISLNTTYRNQILEQTPQSEKEHSYHLTLSY